MNEMDLLGIDLFEWFAGQVIPFDDERGDGAISQGRTAVIDGSETRTLQSIGISQDAEVPIMTILIGNDEIQDQHPIETAFGIIQADFAKTSNGVFVIRSPGTFQQFVHGRGGDKLVLSISKIIADRHGFLADLPDMVFYAVYVQTAHYLRCDNLVEGFLIEWSAPTFDKTSASIDNGPALLETTIG